MRETTKGKRRLGAALSALAVGGFVVLLALCMVADCLGGGTAWETAAILACAGMLFLMTGGIVLALIQRWKEIEKGEEDEARKY